MRMEPVHGPVLPPVPAGAWWNETQWAVLLSLMDAALSPVVAAGEGAAAAAAADAVQLSPADFADTVARVRSAMVDPPDEALVAAYLADRPSDNADFIDALRRSIATLPPDTQKQMGDVLAALSRRAGALLLTGRWTPVHQQPLPARERILQGWQRAWTPALRVLARSLCSLAQTAWLVSAPLFPQASGFREAPAERRTETSFDFAFLQFDGDTTMETDIVIVGSGSGGAVCAEVLAAAGHRVVVVDKGYHYPPAQLPLSQNAGLRLLYENGGQVATTNPNLAVLAGACWGGGSAINWSVCLRTPAAVRREWAAGQPGMAFFESPAFDACLDRVYKTMVPEEDEDGEDGEDVQGANNRGQSHRGRVLLDGAAQLRFQAAPLRQNTRDGRPHDDGYCHLGCASDEKRGATVTWLPAAAAAGAQFIQGFHVDRVLFDADDGSAPTAPGPVDLAAAPQATGIVGTWLSCDAAGRSAGPDNDDDSHRRRRRSRVVIRARKVIVAAGALNSPLLLRRSGLDNPQIGQNLHLHPCGLVGAFFAEETKPMDHGIITSICTSFEDMDGHYHGPRLESTCMVPYVILTSLPWSSGLDFKLAALRYRHYDGFISLTRDRDAGRVFADPMTGQPVIDYAPSDFDRENALEGIIGIARLCHAAGATEIRAYLPGVAPFVRSGRESAEAAQLTHSADDDASFEVWVHDIRTAGLSASVLWGGWQTTMPFGSAHQVGTCRMADDGGAHSVVDPRGRVWGTRGLHVADGSVFPSASGVNPMLTVMALAQWIAQGLVEEMAE